MDISHLLGIFHLTDNLLQLAFTGTVAKRSYDGSNLGEEYQYQQHNRNIGGSGLAHLSHINSFVVLVIKHFKCLHNFAVNLSRQNLQPSSLPLISCAFSSPAGPFSPPRHLQRSPSEHHQLAAGRTPPPLGCSWNWSCVIDNQYQAWKIFLN